MSADENSMSDLPDSCCDSGDCRAVGVASDEPTRVAFAVELPVSLCPGCRLIRFVGHGPLCSDCLHDMRESAALDEAV